ncbi:MAG: hypothetical protein HQL12_01285 [Candidatus Omnitrophica bacterium]|nr:hypothetical protein [Candidatus Omnitrophota bacterium]
MIIPEDAGGFYGIMNICRFLQVQQNGFINWLRVTGLFYQSFTTQKGVVYNYFYKSMD